jgi:hypothetical protein
MSGFRGFLPSFLTFRLSKMGFSDPNSVQKIVIPAVLAAKNDVFFGARSGLWPFLMRFSLFLAFFWPIFGVFLGRFWGDFGYFGNNCIL